MNTSEYVHTMTWLQALTGLIEQMQVRNPVHHPFLLVLLSFFLVFYFYSLVFVLTCYALLSNRCTGIRLLELWSRSGSEKEKP